MPLADALADILFVMLVSQFVEFRFRLEITNAEVNAAVLETMTHDGNQAILCDSIFKRFIELSDRTDGTHTLKTSPCHWLSSLHKVGERDDIKSHSTAVFAAVSGICCLCPATLIGNQIAFNMFFKMLFTFVHLLKSTVVCFHTVYKLFILGHIYTTFLFPVTTS